MATIDENLTYLTDPRRFPKLSSRTVARPTYEQTSEEYNRIVQLLQAIKAFIEPIKPDTTLFIKGYVSLSNIDILTDTSDIGIYYLVDGSLTGTLTVDYDNNSNVTQILISPVTISYDDAGKVVYIAKTSIQTRTYKDGEWTRWVTVSDDETVKSLKETILQLQTKIDDIEESVRLPLFDVDMETGELLVTNGKGKRYEFSVNDNGYLCVGYV